MHDVKLVERLLGNVSESISQGGVSAALSSTSRLFDESISIDFLETVRDQALLYESFDRHLSVCVLILSGKAFAEFECDDIERLLNACLSSGYYTDILDVCHKLCVAERFPSLMTYGLIASYRLSDWQSTLQIASNLSHQDAQSFSRLIIRSCIECRQYQIAKHWIGSLTLEEIQSSRFLGLLKLMLKLELGCSLLDFSRQQLFDVIPLLTQAEAAAVARYLPLLETRRTYSACEESELDSAYHVFTDKLLTPLFSPPYYCTSIKQNHSSFSEQKRIALFLSDQVSWSAHQLNGLICAFAEHHCVLTPLVLGQEPGCDVVCSISRDAPYKVRSTLIKAGYDAVIDTIGLEDSLWIQIVAQRIAPLQLAWQCPNSYLRSSNYYDAWIFDRWSAEDCAGSQSVPSILLSGCAALDLAESAERDKGYEISSWPQSHDYVALFGIPKQLNSESADLLRQLILDNSNLKILLLDPCWNDSELLADWLHASRLHEYRESFSLVNQADLSFLIANYAVAGLVCCHNPPVLSVTQQFKEGMPIVYFALPWQQKSYLHSVMGCLGLDGFIFGEEDLAIEAIRSLIGNAMLRKELSDGIRNNYSHSLLASYRLFAQEISEAVSVLMEGSAN